MRKKKEDLLLDVPALGKFYWCEPFQLVELFEKGQQNSSWSWSLPSAKNTYGNALVLALRQATSMAKGSRAGARLPDGP